MWAYFAIGRRHLGKDWKKRPDKIKKSDWKTSELECFSRERTYSRSLLRREEKRIRKIRMSICLDVAVAYIMRHVCFFTHAQCPPENLFFNDFEVSCSILSLAMDLFVLAI